MAKKTSRKKSKSKGKTIDITPSPRVLRMLGQIDFRLWQCVAELIDNGVDAYDFDKAETVGSPVIEINLPEKIAEEDNRVMVRDYAKGMNAQQLQDAITAGYSSNSPIDKLGLFGMGFNISTARLGSRTEVWTTQQGMRTWVGAVIDFDEMEKKGREHKPYTLELKKKPKSSRDESGTQVIVTKLYQDRYKSMVKSRRAISNLNDRLARIYSWFINEESLRIFLNGTQIPTYNPVRWGTDRTVKKGKDRVPAYIPIDKDLGAHRYCTLCWVWLEEEEKKCPSCGGTKYIISRQRRIFGWLGIQLFVDDKDFGIDFLRNGRKILIQPNFDS